VLLPFTSKYFSSCLLKNAKIKVFKTKILLVVFYGCEILSLTLREAHRLRLFVNKVLRRIFGPKTDEIIQGWRKLHNEELHNLCSSPDIIRIITSRRLRWMGHIACMRK
jgi:hypothetical protein